jgi:hypothetical protein
VSDFVIGLIRTYVPILVGAVIGWLISQGVLDPDAGAAAEAGLITAITAVAQGVYYTAVRLLAEKWPWIGSLLGYNKAPAYNEA